MQDTQGHKTQRESDASIKLFAPVGPALHAGTMSARQVLAIPEILCMVLDHFRLDGWLETDEYRSGKVSIREHRRTLASAARVCRTFLEPSLSALWTVIDGFEPLLGLFASCRQVPAEDTQNDESDGEESFLDDDSRDMIYVLGGAITSREWNRFRYYASLVRVCFCDYKPTVDPSVYLQLSLRNGDVPLLPNLRLLKWEQHSCNSPELLHFAGPSLRQLHFDFVAPGSQHRHHLPRRHDYSLKALLDHTSFRASRLEGLTIRGVHHPDTLSCALHTWTHLQRVYIDNIFEFSTLLDLSKLEHLIFLRADISQIAGAHRACDGFRSLEALELEGDNDSLQWFFEATHLPRLSSLTLVPNTTSTTLAYRAWLERLRLPRAFPGLRSLKLQLTHHASDVRRVLDVVRPFFGLRALEAFELDLPRMADLADDDVRELARHWAHLRSLRLEFTFARVEPTAAALEHLAVECPRLEDLALPSMCHETVVPNAPSAPPQRRLRRFSLCRAMISDRVRFAAFLRALFPNVTPTLPTLFYRRACEDWCLIVDSFRDVRR